MFVKCNPLKYHSILFAAISPVHSAHGRKAAIKNKNKNHTRTLWTLSLNLSFTRLFVLLRRDPHLLKRADTGQYRTANPCTESSFNTAVSRYHFQARI